MQPTIVCLAGRHRASQKHLEILVMPEKDVPAGHTYRPMPHRQRSVGVMSDTALPST